MGKYIFRRLLQGIPTFFGVTFIAYLLMMIAPGDPVYMFVDPNRGSDEDYIETMRRRFSLDKSPVEQYVYWLIGNDWTKVDLDGDGKAETQGDRKGLLRGDLGDSFKHLRPVSELLVDRVPETLLLTFSALVVGYSIGIFLGVLAAVYHGSWIDQVVRIISVVGNAVPQFWLGLLLILIFSVKLDVLPMSGMRDIRNRGSYQVTDVLSHMILPVSVLSLWTIAYISRFTRTELLEVLEQDYVRTAKAKGLSNRTIWWRHALSNAMIPVATFIGPAIGTLLGGAVIIEKVFSWPGMGRLIIDGVFQRDYPLVMGSVVIASVLFILGILLSDILYGVLDPRIRLQ